ncbi:haspin protein kinase [Ophiostoma piceae UAMH 11346]|uniref:non-specific serine/threonine protein kinase n=1 Tax=Ophiostoma piceae (strain UAMH 11346) TaxID=1262450 RepID=S3CF16_OPHP1|nr:haspin protein kinase [Ophiostoma piceae UAMH 11346]
MSRTSTSVHTYGRPPSSRTKPLLFQTHLPVSPTDNRRRQRAWGGRAGRFSQYEEPELEVDLVDDLTEQLTFVSLDDGITLDQFDFEDGKVPVETQPTHEEDIIQPETQKKGKDHSPVELQIKKSNLQDEAKEAEDAQDHYTHEDDSLFLDSYQEEATDIDADLRVLTWADMCPPGDRIEKIAEASYAEVYRVTNERGTSIIKAIRLKPEQGGALSIKPQTKQQTKSGLVDEEPHDEDDLRGELTISEWLADIPGFVVYKERYIVRGKTTKELLETHQAFHRRAKRQDPGRLQFYPSPSRYLDDTRFLVIELGDAGRALEDIALESISQVWDVFLHVAIALARAEDQINFEHRDLHEGNLCVRQVAPPRAKTDDSAVAFGYSGLDITILDYGLSRAEDVYADGDDNGEEAGPIAFDLERDLSLFTSTHAVQCKVYRQMRSYLLKGDRVHLPPDCHNTPYDEGPDTKPISWKTYSPYTNVLWLAYLYGYLVRNFAGSKADLLQFRRTTRELWTHLNPDAPPAILSFSSATDVVRFAVEAGWLTQAQLGAGSGSEYAGDDSFLSNDGASKSFAFDMSLLSQSLPAMGEDGEKSIIEAQIIDRDESEPRRSPRRRRPVERYR